MARLPGTIGKLRWRTRIKLWFAELLTGLLGGLLGRMIPWPQQPKEFVFWRLRRERPIVFAGLCELVVAIIGLIGAN